MKKFIIPIISLFVGASSLSAIGCTEECNCITKPLYFGEDLTKNIPEVKLPDICAKDYGFDKHLDAAQYKQADWSNAVAIIRGISEEQALKYAKDHEEITYFFYTKGYQMVLETENNECRIFHHGDAVFFKGTPWLGTAPDLADAYIKTPTNK